MSQTLLCRVQRDAVFVTGPDATSFLQSLLSQDLDPVAVGDSTHALLLAPQGKLVVDLHAVHTRDEQWCCVCEAGFGATLADGLNRFRIRVDVDIESRSPHTDAVALRGPDASALLASVAVPDGVIVARTDWPTGPGLDVWYEPPAEPLIAALISAGAVEIDADAFETLRIEAGVPRQGFDIDETTIAQEAFLERDAVSFTKGCFLGQELVCRIDSRGHVNRFLRRVRATGPLARGAAVMSGGTDVGTVTSAAGTVGLATIRRTVEPGGEVLIRNGTAEVTARVEAVDA
ncbi:MAG TPA: hypothetical protein VK771_09465 [Acidimicrobiia bacterium]|nr:hypothetical protein [Acidimicrobiia bacterium]